MNFPKRAGIMTAMLALAGSVLAGCGTSTNTNTNSSTSGNAQSTSDKNVFIAYDNYFEDVDVTELWKQALEKHGYNVKTQELSLGAIFTSMYKGGSNSVNVFMDVWMPYTHKVYMDKYGSHFTNLGVWHKPTKIGIVVPQYVYDQGIHSISDLNSHASMFHNQIVGISPGSGEMQTIKSKVVPDYNLKLQVMQGSGPAMLASLEKAEKSHKPIAVTLWSPHWIFGKYKLKYLADPKGAFGKPGVEQIEANKDWAANHQQVAKWMGNFKLTKDQLNTLGVMCQSQGTQKGVQAWIKKNQSLVNSWFQTS